MRRLLKLVLFAVVVVALLAGLAWWRFFAMPGRSHRGDVPALESAQRALAARLEAHVRKLAGEIGPRSLDRPEALARAREYVVEVFGAAGEVQRQRFEANGAEVENVWVDLPGASEELVVVGAHYDTAGPTPGADDNASGVAGVLELSRLLAGAELPHPVRLVAFVGNHGSRSWVRRVVGAFRASAALPSEGMASPPGVIGVDLSDHWSFWQHGYPALMVTDGGPFRNDRYHTLRDTPDTLDYERMALAVDGLARSLRLL